MTEKKRNMIEGEKKHLIESLEIVLKNYVKEKDIYKEMYFYYVNFFKAKNILSTEDVVIGIGFTYSWMPTILKNLNLSIINQVTKILNNVKQNIDISNDDLLILKKFSNNSLVGTSKLLHFINPEKYAIWDSRVYKFLYNNAAPHKYKLEKVETYRIYLKFISSTAQDEQFTPVIQSLKSNFDYEITNLRALELLFFLGSKK